ncbi:xanthine dehydrogenase family protein molybdopterin-binding subunit [candidate division CSSED10-310 bacterium]|uniref:Xanthine dehydrogenase family protein molybdopterin-binding subunit n=1 Tax=candidate division CSSED10-310 bacterium TaxID=2855610 RepID=A0ABV6YVN5_UNCC1
MPVIGKSVKRKDALAKVTGAARYVEDYYYQDMLYGYVVRSEYPHAEILSINTKSAGSLPGVAAVLTASDVPGQNMIPIVYNDLPLLAANKTLFAGEPVALIAAKTRQIAMRAAQRIKIRYKEHTPILSIEGALKPEAPRIYGSDNIFTHHRIIRGNVEQGFAAADIILEDTFQTGYQEHAYIERQGMIAVPGSDGTMTVIGSMQCPFYVHEALATLLNLPYNQIKVIQTVTGGAFGGKEDVPSIVAGQAAILAHFTRKPVKLIYEREEDMISMSKRHPSLTKIKLGLSGEGYLQAIHVDYKLNAGAYSTLSPVVLWRGAVHATGPYRYEHALVEAYAVATNLVPCGAFRGFGSPQIIFAIESMMDMAAFQLNLDPAELRKRNIFQQDDVTITGQILKESVGLEQTLKQALQHSKWHDKTLKNNSTKQRRRRGKGLSCFHYGVGLGAGGKRLARAGADVVIFADSSVAVAVGNTEMGQGSETVLAQIAADSLNAPFENIRILPVDTTKVPDSGPTVASRTTFMSGNAIKKACLPIRQRIDAVAADLLHAEPEALSAKEGFFQIVNKKKKKQDQEIHFTQVVQECFQRREQMSNKGWYISPETTWNPETGQGDAYIVYSYATIVAEVEVDVETGEVTVLKLFSAHDMGKAINPQQVEGQIEGGAIQGFSYALMEDIVHEHGIMQNPNFATYIFPTFLDVPSVQPLIVEAPYSAGPDGAKGIGEPPLMGIAPAVTNAIFDAVGVRCKRLPVFPEHIFQGLKQKETS